MLYNLTLNFLYTVPQPSVEITTPLSSTPVYAGTPLTLRCGIGVGIVVDTSYTIAVTWLKSGTVISSNFRTNVSNVTQLSLFSYEATLTLNPLSSAVDTGTYTCRVTVTPTPPSPLVRGVTHFDTETITVQGRQCITEPLSCKYGDPFKIGDTPIPKF